MFPELLGLHGAIALDLSERYNFDSPVVTFTRRNCGDRHAYSQLCFLFNLTAVSLSCGSRHVHLAITTSRPRCVFIRELSKVAGDIKNLAGITDIFYSLPCWGPCIIAVYYSVAVLYMAALGRYPDMTKRAADLHLIVRRPADASAALGSLDDPASTVVNFGIRRI